MCQKMHVSFAHSVARAFIDIVRLSLCFGPKLLATPSRQTPTDTPTIDSSDLKQIFSPFPVILLLGLIIAPIFDNENGCLQFSHF